MDCKDMVFPDLSESDEKIFFISKRNITFLLSLRINVVNLKHHTMKKYLLIILTVAFIGTATKVNAQSNAIKVNIFSLLVKTGSFFYERALNDNMTGQLGFYYTGFKLGDTKFSGFGITPEFRYYFDEALHGFYAAPYLRYQNFTLSSEYTDYDINGNPILVTGKATLSTFGGGALIGHQWCLGDIVTLDIFLGPGFNAGSVKVTDGNASFETGSFDGFNIRTGLTFGIAF
jgi:hypothetical protein